MNKGRSIYQINLAVEPEKSMVIINEFLKINKFKLTVKNGEQYYKSGSAWTGNLRFFNYTFNGNVLIIYAWIKGAAGDIKLEQDSLIGSAAIENTNYRNVIERLIIALENVNQKPMNFDPQTGKPINNQTNNALNSFKEQSMRSKEKAVGLAFAGALFALPFSFVGATYDIVIYMLIAYYAINGLQTRKKGLAVATIIISIISVIIAIAALQKY